MLSSRSSPIRLIEKCLEDLYPEKSHANPRKNVLRVPKFLINFALRVKTIKTFPADEPEQFGFNR